MKTVVILSGGMDSTTLLYLYARSPSYSDGDLELKALSFDYGQRHGQQELKRAKYHAGRLGVDHDVVDLKPISKFLFSSGSVLIDHSMKVPEGHYESSNMKQTVVPNRNMIMLAVATGHAISIGAESVAYGAHPGDHAVYPDCRPEFASAMDLAVSLCDWSKVRLKRPFVADSIDKAGIVKLSVALDLDLSTTWSCYNGRELHCGNCGTCVERREAFHLADVNDSTVYESSARGLDALLKERS